MKIILTITALLIIAAPFLYIHLKKKRLMKEALQCAELARRFHERLQELSAPSHFFTDEEVHQLKKEFNPVLDRVNRLYASSLISTHYLNELGLRDFIDERRLVNHFQNLNNTAQLPPEGK